MRIEAKALDFVAPSGRLRRLASRAQTIHTGRSNAVIGAIVVVLVDPPRTPFTMSIWIRPFHARRRADEILVSQWKMTESTDLITVATQPSIGIPNGARLVVRSSQPRRVKIGGFVQLITD